MIVRHIKTALRNGARSSIGDLFGKDLERITFDKVIEAAQAGDAVASEALTEAGKWLGIGIVNMINTFNPELIVLGGALGRRKRFPHSRHSSDSTSAGAASITSSV